MHHLYDGNRGYSQEATLLQRVLPTLWKLTREKVLQHLQDNSHEKGAMKTLRELPFELWRADPRELQASLKFYF